MEQRGCHAFGLILSPPASLAAGCLPRSAAQFLVNMTGLDDLDNAASEEDDSCQGSVKLAFLPLACFFFPFQLSIVPRQETVSYDPQFLLWAPARRIPARCLFCFSNARLATFFFSFPEEHGWIKFLMAAVVARWTNKGDPKSKRLVVHFWDADGHTKGRQRYLCGRTYQAFGSWGAGARRDRWDGGAASLCCWEGCLSGPQIQPFF